MNRFGELQENSEVEATEHEFDAAAAAAEIVDAWQQEYGSKPPSLTTEGQLVSAITQKLNSERGQRNEKDMAELVNAFASATDRLVMTEDGARRLKKLLDESADSYNIGRFAV